MKKETITTILKTLANKRAVFTSEADFQFSLAWEIQNTISESKVLLEYPVLKEDGTTIYIDIVVVIGETKHPIELKYKTKALKSVNIYDTTINLKNQAAQDLGRYAYLKDIYRIEELQRDMGFSTGYAIMITNDMSYVDSKSSTPNCLDYNFRIHNGKIISGELLWNTSTTDKKHWMEPYPPIEISGKYTMNWSLYSTYDDCEFQLLISEI